jgi:hypothetical protein
MNRLKYQRWLLVSILASGLLILSGCESGVCKNGAQPLTANWAEKKLPVVEGAEVCDCDAAKIRIVHRNAEFFELADQYAEKLKVDGWQISPVQREKTSRRFIISKDKEDKYFRNNIISLDFRDCSSLHTSFSDRRSKCVEVQVFDPSESLKVKK